jgi:gliding motility-associated-like protein
MRNYTLQSLFAPKKRLLLLIILCFITFTFSNAQNLISNGGFESTGGYSSNYSLIVPSGNSSPGQYAITTNPKPVNTANFVTSTDHSGTGNMMIVDGQNSDIFYKYTNLPIQRGQNYTFTYWIKNVNNVTNGTNPAPKIDLTLSNQCPCTKTLIAGNSDVGLMPAGWNKVSYTINVAGTGTAYIHFELSTNSAGGGGNDFAIDDISLYAPPAPLTISTSLTNPSCPTGNDGVIVAYPNGGVSPFTFTLSGMASATNSTGIFQNLAGGTYSVSVTDSNSPTSSVSTPAILVAPSDITLNASPTGCLLSGASVTLTAANGGATYGWSASPGGAIAGTSNSIVVNPTTTTTYTVTSTTIPPSVGNLIGNPGFENGTSGFYSDYGYSLSNTGGTQFAYGVVTKPSNWYGAFTDCGDHGGTGSGKMLVADGATTAGSIVWSQTVPVEVSKLYTFSFWAQNIGTGVKAPLVVNINGIDVILNVSATNNVTGGSCCSPSISATTTCGWTNFTGTWTSDALGNPATIKIWSNSNSGGGNDFAIDDLSFSTVSSKSCPLSISKTVTIGGTVPVIGFSYTSPVCKNGTNPTPTGVSGFVTGGNYSSTAGLSINATTGVIDLATSTAGTYTVNYAVLANASTCQLAGSSTATITINSVPSILTTPSGNLCGSGVVSMSATATVGSTINWYTATTGGAFTTGNTVNTPASISASTNYYVDATLNGCTSSPRTMVTATIKPIPTILTSPGGSLCGPGIVNMSATATAGSTINWYTATTGASFGTGNSINTPTSISSTTTYYVDATLNGCTSTTRTPIVATVNPALTFTCGTQTNSSVTFNWSTVSGATSYDYTYTKSSGGSAITGNTTAITLNVTGLSPNESVTISVKPIGSPCSIFVGPFICAASLCNTPTTNPITDISSCANDVIPIQVITSPLGATATFTWANDNTAIGLAASGTGDLPSFTAANVTTTQIAKITVNAFDPATSCTGPDMVFFITVNPLPTVTVNSPSVCAGTSATVTATPGITGTYTYAWTVPATATLPGNVASFSTTVVGNYSVVITNTATTCVSASVSGTVTINPLPTVTVNTLPVCFGNSATVTAVPGIAGTYTYTWTTPTGAIPPGNVASFSTTVAGNYSVIIADVNCSSASAANTVVINPLPTVTVNSPTVCAGTSATVTAAPGIAGTYNYAWTVPVTAIAPGNVASFSTTVAGNYSVILTDPTTTCASASASGLVTITPLPTLVLTSAATTTLQALCINTAITPITYTVGGSATNAMVTGLPTGVNGIFASGVFTITGIPTVSGTFNYTVTTTGGCLPAVSLFGTITVSPLSTLILTSAAVTTNQILCMNTALSTITYAVGGSATGAIVTGLPTGVTGSFTGGGVAINGTPTVSGSFNYTVTTTGGCSPTVILGGTITVKPLSTLVLSSPIATATQTICLTDAIASITYIVGGSATGANVTGLPAGVTGNFVSGIFTISGTPTVAGTYNYSVNTTGGCSPAITLYGSITVNPLPIADFTGLTAICSGDVTAIVLSSTISGTTFSWNAVQNNVTGASSSNGSTINQTLTATGNNMGQVVYNVTPVIGSCSGSPKMITINVSPVPNVIENTAKKTLCSGETTSIDLSSAIVGATFSWTVNATGVAGATAGTGNKIAQLLSNLGSVPGTVDYTITPSVNGCLGTPVTVTITVNPLPEVLGTPPGTICSGDTTSITLSPTIAGTTFDWTVAQVGVIGATAGTGNTINQILDATGNSQGNVTYTITPSLNGCVGSPLDIIINVNPAPKPTLEDGVICVEEATGVAYKTYTLDSGLSDSNYNFQWYLNSLPINGAIASTYEATQSGDYTVMATNNVTGCYATSEAAKVIASFPGLDVSTAQTLAFSDNAKVTVTVTGGNAVFEYQLDDGSFQSSNVFEYLKPGPHTITVGDTNGCTNLTENFFVIGYPKFFTPNGDGPNDSWNVVGLEAQPKSIIYIFDRYGKLIKQISPTGEGWDGFYIGNPLPATDYWFTVEFSEQSETKLFKAHFSLIR